MNSGIQNGDLDKSVHLVDGQTPTELQRCFLSGPPIQDPAKVSLDVGTELMDGRFVVKEKIGLGRLFVVYQAHDRKLQDDIALKIGAFSPLGGGSMERLLMNEHRVNSFVTDKRHVLTAYEVNRCTYDGALLVLLSMEYADGGSLRDWLKNNEYDLQVRQSQGYAIFRQICLGLASLHESSVCHLDLKPENILFVKGVAKIADFGISSLKYSSMHGHGNDMPDLLHHMGTSRYMSPEQFIAPHIMNIDMRSDIYSLTVVLFEMSHPECKTPFEGNDEFQRFQHVQAPVPEIEAVSEAVRRVIKRGLQKRPDDRYRNIIELIQDFDGRLHTEQETVSQEHPESSESVEPTQDCRQAVDGLWDETLAKIHEPDFDAAILLCRRIIGLDPNHGKAAAALRELERRFEKAHQFYTTIKSGMGTESLDHLAELLVEAVNVYPNHPEGHLVQMQLSSRSRQFAETMERRMELVRRDRQQNRANVNRNRTPNTPCNSRSATRSRQPFRPAVRRWYHKLLGPIRRIVSG